MRKLFKNTKNKQSGTLLYQKYLLQTNNGTGTSKPAKQSKAKKVQIDYIFPKYIGVAAIAHGAGASHLSYAVANYFAVAHKKRVVLVSESPELFKCTESFKVERKPLPEIIEKMDIYIQDYGCLEDISKDQFDTYRVMEKKILCCNYSDHYLECLAEFVRSYVKDPDQWMFAFNQLTAKNQKEVADLMEGYHFVCPPAYDKDDIKQIERLMVEVFGK